MARKSITPVRSVNEDRRVNTPSSSQTVSIGRARLIDYDDSTLTHTQPTESEKLNIGRLYIYIYLFIRVMVIFILSFQLSKNR